MAVSAWPIIRAALGDFRRAWAQLVLADLVALALIVAVLTPAVGLLLQLFLVRTATVVVTDHVTRVEPAVSVTDPPFTFS